MNKQQQEQFVVAFKSFAAAARKASVAMRQDAEKMKAAGARLRLCRKALEETLRQK